MVKDQNQVSSNSSKIWYSGTCTAKFGKWEGHAAHCFEVGGSAKSLEKKEKKPSCFYLEGICPFDLSEYAGDIGVYIRDVMIIL